VPIPGTPSRDDGVTMPCLACARPFPRSGRRRYCTDACRQAAWRRRTAAPAQPAQPPPHPRSRRDRTVYQCAECDTRYLGEQWCFECTRPCRRLGPGGACDCGELLTVEELLQGG
jgi:hypothetical protein